MTGREKIEAALSTAGTPEIAAVICYEGIFVRDHWAELSDQPWWMCHSTSIEKQVSIERDILAATGMDWFRVSPSYSRIDRKVMALVREGQKVFRVNTGAGTRKRLFEPRIGGWSAGHNPESIHPAQPAATREDVDRRIPSPPAFDAAAFEKEGRGDLAAAMIQAFPDRLPMAAVASPLWAGYDLWGFEGLMTMVADNPSLVEYACARSLERAVHQVKVAAALGARAMWVEECLTDMISPAMFARLNLPFLRKVVDAVRDAGMSSIYYYCGNPNDRWDMLLASGADALSLEESKKGFTIDIDEVVARVRGRMAVLGNLDAIDLLRRGTEEDLRREITRQIAAGRRNGSRFIMSIGSPVTPETPVTRVRQFCDLAHQLGSRA